MKTKTQKHTPLIHDTECRSVLTSEQAENCPLCRVRSAAPDLLETAKLAADGLSQAIICLDEEEQSQPIAKGQAEALEKIEAAIAKAEGQE